MFPNPRDLARSDAVILLASFRQSAASLSRCSSRRFKMRDWPVRTAKCSGVHCSSVLETSIFAPARMRSKVKKLAILLRDYRKRLFSEQTFDNGKIVCLYRVHQYRLSIQEFSVGVSV